MDLDRSAVIILPLFLIFIFFVVPVVSLFIIYRLTLKKRNAAKADMKASKAQSSN
jgi:uncharacterized membrane protein